MEELKRQFRLVQSLTERAERLSNEGGLLGGVTTLKATITELAKQQLKLHFMVIKQFEAVGLTLEEIKGALDGKA